MAMTEAVKDELGRLSVTRPCCRKAEVSALLRFAGGLHVAAGKIIVEVELDAAQTARRLRKDISEILVMKVSYLLSLPVELEKAVDIL